MLKADGNPDFIGRSVQPLYSVFSPFYDYGLFAVQLFWMISGFVFSTVYLGIKPTARLFFNHRFARLYPLHFITLIIVASLQWISFESLGRFQIYPFNDFYHFMLNLFFIPGWGFQKGQSFNDPVWSVSVELAIYVIFFLMIPILFRSGLAGPILFALFFLLAIYFHFAGSFSHCGFFFFLGSVIYIFLQNFKFFSLPAGLALLLAFGCAVVKWPHLFSATYLLAMLFSGLVLISGYLDERCTIGVIAAKFSWIGDNTYSVYLIHVSIQIALMTLMDFLGLNRSYLVSQTWFFLIFMAIVLSLGRITFLYVEKPSQRFFRQKS